MPIGRRLELLRFADAAGACIIEDDYDSEFHYEARPVAALQGLAPSPHIFYLGTFSKSTYADIRLGYLVVPEALIEIFESAHVIGDAGAARDAGGAGRIIEAGADRRACPEDGPPRGTARSSAASARQRPAAVHG